MSFTTHLTETITSWCDSINYPTTPEGLYQPIEYTMSSGGKRLRPTLLLAAAEAFGAEPDVVKDQCLGIEMFHNFTLLHDDVMDGADLRRGHPTVHRRWSENTAILSGDAMLTMSSDLMMRCPDDKLRPVLDIFNRTAMEVYEGQQYDMDFEDRDNVTVDEYLEMIRLKTSVLLGCALKIGAIMAGAPNESVEALYNYGIDLGLGFQLQDDYLDTFGDPLIFGKQIGGDILNDKKTWLMITASSEDESGFIHSGRLDRLEGEEKVHQVTEVYKTLKLDSRIRELIEEYSERAVSHIEKIEMRHEAREYFISLARKLVDRSH